MVWSLAPVLALQHPHQQQQRPAPFAGIPRHQALRQACRFYFSALFCVAMPGCLSSPSPGSKCLQNEEKSKFASENCAQPHPEERELTFTEHPPCAWDHAKCLHVINPHSNSESRYYYPLFTEEETTVQPGGVTCPRSNSLQPQCWNQSPYPMHCPPSFCCRVCKGFTGQALWHLWNNHSVVVMTILVLVWKHSFLYGSK